MNTPEIVTLQIGHYSNFVGSHWWNCQESSFVYDPKAVAQSPKEINHDVLYREGHTIKGEVTYTPRLVLFDLNNSLGSMKREGILYDVTGEEHVRWQGDVTLHQAMSAEKNPYLLDIEREAGDEEDNENVTSNKMEEDLDEILPKHSGDDKKAVADSNDSTRVFGSGRRPFYQLEDKVKVWSDFLGTSLHSKSVHIVKEHQHNNPEQPFDVFGVGQQVLSSRESLDAMEDRIRFFTEECDRLQGFHVLLDTHNAFGGLAAPILDYLSDEYPNKPRFSFSLTPASPPDQTPRERSCRIINSALSLQACSRHTSLHLPLSLASGLWRSVGPPLSLPHLQYQPDLDYHTSAILAAILDTVTLTYRRVDNSCKMYDISSAFGCYGRKVTSLNATFPLPLSPYTTLADHLMALQDRDPWVSFTPHVTQGVTSPTFQSCVVRGLPNRHITSSPKSSSPLSNQLSSCSSVEDVLRLYLTETFPGSVNAGCVMRDPIKLDTSFPHIFSPDINSNGLFTDVSRPPFCGVESVPVMTSLQSGPSVGHYIHSVSQAAGRMTLAKHQHFVEAGLDPDDYAETLQDLKDLALCYS